MRPEQEELDDSTLAMIADSAEPHDPTFDAKVERFLGGPLSRAEETIGNELPDGWSVRIESA